MKHIISPYENQQHPPTDRNDPVGAATAVEIRFPETFSERAWKVINYFDGTMFLYIYKGKFVATDESLELTAYGDGTEDAPLGFPRWTGDSLDELESWLEAVADDYDEAGDMEGWVVEKNDESAPDLPTGLFGTTFWLIVEMLYNLISAVYCVRTQKQAEAAMDAYIDNYMLRKESLTCVYAKEQLSCVDKDQCHTFSAKEIAIDTVLSPPRPKLTDPYHLHPMPLHDVCVEAMERGFSTIFDPRLLLHTPLGEFIDDMDARDYDDTYGYVRFGNIIVGLSDVWETEAEIYELE